MARKLFYTLRNANSTVDSHMLRDISIAFPRLPRMKEIKSLFRARVAYHGGFLMKTVLVVMSRKRGGT